MFTEVKAAIDGPITNIISSIMLSTENAVIKTGPETNNAVQRARTKAPIEGAKKPLMIAKTNIQTAGRFEGIVKINAIEVVTAINICHGSTRCCPTRSVSLEVSGPPIAAEIAPTAETDPAKA